MHWWGRRWVQRDDSTAWKATQRVSQDCREDAGLRGWSRRPSLDVVEVMWSVVFLNPRYSSNIDGGNLCRYPTFGVGPNHRFG